MKDLMERRWFVSVRSTQQREGAAILGYRIVSARGKETLASKKFGYCAVGIEGEGGIGHGRTFLEV
ncbi:MAG TPA: hypothetical protein VN688_33230 [Gemmataceae bacterium]|nr:hypothetical protein [Gemmataceae bacterium]